MKKTEQKILIISTYKDKANFFIPKIIPIKPDEVSGYSFKKYWLSPAKNIKSICRVFPEFAIEPEFIVEDNKLVWKQFGEILRFEPRYFGLKQEQIQEGQKIRIDIESYSIERPSNSTLKKISQLPFIDLSHINPAFTKPIFTRRTK